MCETNAYVRSNGEEDLFFENVDILRPEGEKLYMRNLFGEEMYFHGSVEEISLMKRRIILRKK